jgi:pimeloyl-ACP methyl ester carboxylesterase
MMEEPLQFGEGGRLFGILTRPDEAKANASTIVLLNAGFLHRMGPHRLHVSLARRFAAHGMHSLRVDLGGRGDSLAPAGISYPESVAADFAEILDLLSTEIGTSPIVVVGLCSGADNAIRLAPDNPQITGMVLLDPVCEKDEGFAWRAARFAAREFAAKASRLSSYAPALKRRVDALALQASGLEESEAATFDALELRGHPTPNETRLAFQAIRERHGRVLSVFTTYALLYYNQEGQMGRVLGIDGYDDFASEIFWPEMRHTYPLETHRLRLIDEIEAWATRQRGCEMLPLAG